MNILHVINSIDPHCGGPSNVIRHLVREQVDLGHRVSVVTTRTQVVPEWLSHKHYAASMRADRFFKGASLHIADSLGRRPPVSNFAFSRDASVWLDREFRDVLQRPEVVHIHGVFSHLTHRAAAVSRRHRVPYVIRPAGTLDDACFRMNRTWLKQLYWHVYLRNDLRRTATVHATASLEQEEIDKRLPGLHVTVIPLGVDIPQIDITDARSQFLARHPCLRDRPVVLFMARIDPKKRLDLLVSGFARAKERHPDLHLVVVGGDSGHLDTVRLHVSRLPESVASAIIFTGYLEGSIKSGAIAASRILVHPSIDENFGLPPIEAMAFGIPAVVTRGVGSATHVDRSGCGVIVESDPAAIADAIHSLLRRDPDDFRQSGPDYVRRFLTWPNVAQQVDTMYRAVLGHTQSQVTP